MTLKDTLSRLFRGRGRGKKPGKQQRKARSFQPLIEHLEERWAPSASTLPAPAPAAGVISGLVSEDGQDIGGVTVTLTGMTTAGNAVDVSTQTNSGGSYEFLQVDAGTYTLTRSSDVYVGGTATLNAGTLGGSYGDNTISTITLQPGQVAASYDFTIGYLSARVLSLQDFLSSASDSLFTSVSPAGAGEAMADGSLQPNTSANFSTGTTTAATLSGTIDNAMTSDPISASAEIALTGIDSTGDSVFQETTATDGAYSFSLSEPGTYSLQVVGQVSGFTAVAPSIPTSATSTAGGLSLLNSQIYDINIAAGSGTYAGYDFEVMPNATPGTPTNANGPVVSAELADDTGASSSDQVTADPSVQGTVAQGTDNSPIKTVEVSVNGSAMVNVTSSVNGGNFYLNQGQLEKIAGTGADALKPGANTITVQTVDQLGMANSATVSFTWQTAAPATPTLTIEQPTTGAVTAASVTAGGSGYTSAPTVSFMGGGGTGAMGTATISSGGVVTSIAITSEGSGYTSLPTIMLSGGGGSGATASAVLDPLGAVVSSTGGVVLSNPSNLTGGTENLQFTTTTGDVVQLFLNGSITALGTETADANGNVVFSNVALSAGVNNFVARAEDAAGNISQLSTFIVLSQAPVAADNTSATNITVAAGTTSTVTSATVTDGGSGYKTAPTVTITGGGGSGASATATISGGAVTGISITNPGSGYTSVPTISFSGGGGKNAAATADITATVLNLADGFTDPNSGNTIVELNTSDGPVYLEMFNSATPQTVANFLAYINSGEYNDAVLNRLAYGSTVGSADITSGGGGYTLAPTVTISGGGGSGATATATISDGAVTAIDITDDGSGYKSAPTITFSGGGGSGAAATAVLPPFVLQGGNYDLATNPTSLQLNSPISTIGSEQSLTGNTTNQDYAGTLSMALTSSGGVYDQSSGSDQFFFNLTNNSSAGTTNLDPNFTVFAKVLSGADMRVLDALAAAPVFNEGSYSGDMQTFPLNNYSGSSTDFPANAAASNFELIDSASIVSQPDVLTYQVTNVSDPSSVLANDTVTVNANGTASLNYKAGATGTVTLTVTATDLAGQTATQTFKIAVGTTTTTTNATTATTGFSSGSQTVTLTGTVTPSSGTVNAGNFTFTVAGLGSVTSGTVTDNTASATFAVPAGTTPQALTITTAYSGGGAFAPSTNSSGTLTITTAATTAAATMTGATESASSQVVTLVGNVTSSGGPVSGGTLTFTVGSLGTVTSGTVANGVGSASINVPANLPLQSIAITTSYSGSEDFAASSNNAGSFVVGDATTTSPTTPAAIDFSSASQTVTLTGSVASGVGTVDAGTITFTVGNLGSVTSGTVSGGMASAIFTVPAGTDPQTLTITTVYNGGSDGTNFFAPSSDDTGSLTIRPVSLSQSTVATASPSIPAAGTTMVTLTAIDSDGVQESSGGLSVAFASSLGNTFSNVTDNGDGTYTATYTGTIAGSDTITATIDGQTVVSSAPLTVGPISLSQSTVATASPSIPAAGTTTITLTAIDTDDVQESSGGLSVAFASSLGNTISNVTDNGDGTYTATYTGTIAGSDTITATIDGQTVVSSAPLTVGPVSLAQSTVATASPSIPAAGTTTVTLTAIDADDVQESSGGLSVAFASSLGNTFTNLTDNGDGTYTATYTGTIAGSDTITATINGQPVVSSAALMVGP